jgi:predicted nucleotidyltransferase
MPKTTKTSAARRHIARIVKRIVEKFHPEQVILFGSQARGDAGPDSDIDLLVVMPIRGSKLEAGLLVRRAVGDCPIPFDLVLSTPEEFAWRKDVVGTIEWPATKEGKVLYARAKGRRHSRSRVARKGRK